MKIWLHRARKSTPSEQAAALLGRDVATDRRDANDLYRFEQTTGASYILSPHAEHSGGRWNMTLDGGQPLLNIRRISPRERGLEPPRKTSIRGPKCVVPDI